LPLIESNLSNQVLLALLLASIAINILLAILIYGATKKRPFKLKYSIYWDSEKNPHCPSCQKPVAAYGKYTAGKGYYCKPCGKVFPLADASGNDMAPADVVKQL
jgi:tRNA(Ile2) C34 agmatinyltransferase TiaS